MLKFDILGVMGDKLGSVWATRLLVISFTILLSIASQASLSYGEFVQRTSELSRDVGTSRCECSSILESVRNMESAHTRLPQIVQQSAVGYMNKLVYDNPSFDACFKGEKRIGGNCGICSRDSGKSALVVMDMQGYFSARNGAIRNSSNRELADAAIQEQIKAIEEAKKNKLPIMVVEYDINNMSPVGLDGSGLPYWKDTDTDPRIMAALEGYDNYQVIKKNTDSFLSQNNNNRRQVVDFFREHDTQQIIMTGANGGACVARSIAQALGNNCEVVAYSRGIADFNYDSFVFPYAGNYSSFTDQVNMGTCDTCVFREVHSMETLAPLMRQRFTPVPVETSEAAIQEQ